MTQSEFIAKMQDIYGDVYDRLHSAGYGKLARFFPVEGKKYREGENRLMLVGRCTRRWWLHDFKFDTKEKYMAKAGEAFSHGLGFDFWVDEKGKSKWGEVRNRATKEFIRCTKDPEHERKNLDKDKEKLYIAKLSVPFFSYSQPILEHLIETTNSKNPWYERIVWSNLYPVQEEDRNTDSDMRKILHEPCVELLKTQIEYFNPTHIVFNTAWEASGVMWFGDFAELFTDVSGSNKICLVPNLNDETAKIDNKKPIVVAKGKYKYIPVVVTSRSDAVKNRPPKESYARQVCDAFDEIEKTM